MTKWRAASPVSVFFLCMAIICILPMGARAGETSGISDKEIVFGGILPLTGPQRLTSEPYEQGVRAFFRSVNEAGGIDGRKITWSVEDDAYTPSRTVAAAKKLVERDDVFMIFGQFGTATGYSIVPYLEQQHVPMLMFTAGPTKIAKYTFGGSATYVDDIKALVKYLIEKGGAKRIGLFYQNDDLGENGRLGAKEALKEAAMEPAAEVGFERTATEVLDTASQAARREC